MGKSVNAFLVSSAHQSARRLFSAALAFCFLLALSAPAFGQSPTPPIDDVIRVETDLTNLFFTATDRNKRFVITLQETDLRVLEDNAPQQILTFQRETDRPVSIAFLIDVSASEARTIGQEKAAARSFIEAILRTENDEAAIIPFADRAFLEQGFTNNRISLYHALSQVDIAQPLYFGSGRPIGGLISGPGTGIAVPGTTALWDALTLTAREIMASRAGNRRRTIIMLTDGRDTSSRSKREAAIDEVIASETVVYGIGIGDERLEGVDKGVIRKIAEATGGRAFFPKKEQDLKEAFAEIEREMRSQYLVAYTSTNKNRDGSFRRMRIDVVNPDLHKEELRLRYRPGYFARKVSSAQDASPE